MLSSLNTRFTSVPGVRRIEPVQSRDNGDRASEEEAGRTAQKERSEGTISKRAVDGSEESRKGEDDKRPSQGELTEEQRQQVEELKARDREVRAHEAAHKAAAAGLRATGPNYTYQSGPDGQRYAVGGEVNIDTSPGRTPEETVRKADQIIRAARAPAEPSGQDQAVAAQAAAMGAQARSELAAEKGSEEEDTEPPPAGATPEAAEGAQVASASDAAPKVTHREGGVDGGHAHVEGDSCPYCSRGIEAYERAAD